MKSPAKRFLLVARARVLRLSHALLQGKTSEHASRGDLFKKFIDRFRRLANKPVWAILVALPRIQHIFKTALTLEL